MGERPPSFFADEQHATAARQGHAAVVEARADQLQGDARRPRASPVGDDRRGYTDQSVRPDQGGPVRCVRLVRPRGQVRDDRRRRGRGRVQQQDRQIHRGGLLHVGLRAVRR